jgi:hypothetical protein
MGQGEGSNWTEDHDGEDGRTSGRRVGRKVGEDVLARRKSTICTTKVPTPSSPSLRSSRSSYDTTLATVTVVESKLADGVSSTTMPPSSHPYDPPTSSSNPTLQPAVRSFTPLEGPPISQRISPPPCGHRSSRSRSRRSSQEDWQSVSRSLVAAQSSSGRCSGEGAIVI